MLAPDVTNPGQAEGMRPRSANSIQLALSDQAKAASLRALLARSTQLEVQCVDNPDTEQACVVVVDAAHLDRLRTPLPHPDRVVLITRSDPNHLREAWEAGINSVVSDQDSVNTVVLAVLSACLRAGCMKPKPEREA
jgi:DNA-binding NarL/FixJ family response regulator